MSSNPKKTKYVLIKVNGSVSFVSYTFEEVRNSIQDDVDHLILGAHSYRGLNYVMWVGDCSLGKQPPNKVATSIATYMKSLMEVHRMHIHGPTLLQCDDRDITVEMWNAMRETIKYKKVRAPPQDLVDYIENLEPIPVEVDAEEASYSKMVQKSREWFYNLSNYGKVD